ncbi:TPA: hypothetical protein ND549_005444 [Klebsiella michiganensis]|uniref:hypothetical protein n=1 Tax=Klebsiella michiganensis TaxID=1134687 RepID=UPI000FF8F6A9|nr:hypothetical protein [Klebsiella michiganensis]QAS64418.1 hypothetical protein KOCBH_01861 [Klebsiella michiganensis]HCD5322466.1 hypothetical protein [Klebsiella michiganensis]HCD7244578.1 hypothetical protein [Klebsiella michiganensis]HCD7467850.1 hypothetical protein [Klebsiella michiganensis]HCD7474005.1 hypothetical protein [Klebsiella michiganensis]
MMDITVSRVRNVVDFKVDHESLRKAKDSIKGIKEFAENQKIAIKPFVDQRALNKSMKQAIKQAKANNVIMQNAQNKANNRVSGTNTPNNNNTQAKQQARAQAAAIKRQDQADLKMRATRLQLGGIIGRTAEEEARVLREAQAITDQYKAGTISMARQNQLIKEQITLLRRAARTRQVEANAHSTGGFGKRLGSLANGATGGLATGGVLGMAGGMLGPLAGAAVVAGGLTGVANSAKETRMVVQGAKAVGVDPNLLLAMSQWGQSNGVDSASPDKIQDNLKDIRERLGDTAANSTFDKKSGKWKGGDQGVNSIMNATGMSLNEVKQYQDSPADFLNVAIKKMQAKGMSDAEMGHQIEDLGDDLLYYLPLFKNNAKALSDQFAQMKQDGALLTEEQKNSAVVLGDALSRASGSLDGAWREALVGFVNAMGGPDGMAKTVEGLTPLFKVLGAGLGLLVNIVSSVTQAMTALVTWIGDLLHIPELSANVNKQTQMADSQPTPSYWGINRDSDNSGYKPNVPVANDLVSGAKANIVNQPVQVSLAPVINVAPATVQQTIELKPDTSSIGPFVDFQVTSKLQAQANQLAIDIQGATSASGN